jgi:hypothetical protein
MKALIPIIVGVVLLLVPHLDAAKPEADAVSKACDYYEHLFRATSKIHADKLDLGSIKTEQESRDFRAAALSAALKDAFAEMAANEAHVLQGKWSPEAESALLRSYVRE